MGNQDREVERAHSPYALVAYRSRMRMVDQIGNQKQRGNRKGHSHHHSVSLDLPLPNQQIPDEEQHRAGRIQTGVDRRKQCVRNHLAVFSGAEDGEHEGYGGKSGDGGEAILWGGDPSLKRMPLELEDFA